MVRTQMSSENSDAGQQQGALCKGKEKAAIQQSLINSSARTLMRLKESTSRLCTTANLNGSTPNFTNGEAQSAIDDEIKLQENKLMKGFSNQLIEKHRYVKLLEKSGCSDQDVERAKHEFDSLISCKQFLDVAGLESSIAADLLEEMSFTLDTLFQMSYLELEQLVLKHSMIDIERKKLYHALDQLSMFYGMWERGEKPSVNSLGCLRCTSSTSRMNSISMLSSFGEATAANGRSDSISSSASNRTSPLPLYASTSSSIPTPVTPSSSQSLLSPLSPFTTALITSTPLNGSFATPPMCTSYAIPILTPPPMSPGYNAHMLSMSSPHGLIRSHSSSSSSILQGMTPLPSHGLARNHHSVSCLSGNKVNNSVTSGNGTSAQQGSVTQKKPLTHKRSLSNPPANIVLNHPINDSTLQEATHLEHAHHRSHCSTTASMQDCHYQSPSPPTRSGSQPSIHYNNVGSSPQPQVRSSHHPMMKHVATTHPFFSKSVSSNLSASATESTFYRQNTWQAHDAIGGGSGVGLDRLVITPRCNSMAGMSRPSSHNAHDIRLTDLTSSSMVDLPVSRYDGSIEHLSQDEDCTLPNSVGKSQSVPRLTLMTVTSDSERGFAPSTSNPTSPCTPGTCTPTGLMRHKITHRFVTKTYITPHVCDYCKKTVMKGVRCKDCKYKCHKSCAAEAPPSCGLPKELMNFFRKHIALSSSMERLVDQRVEPQVPSPSDREKERPRMERSRTFELDTRDPGFIIPDLTSEPTTTHYSPVMSTKKPSPETVSGIALQHQLSSQSSCTSLLEVPHLSHLTQVFHSTSSTPSPSTSPPTSPSLTPSSPHSPNDYIPAGYAHYPPFSTSRKTGVVQAPIFIKRNESGDEEFFGSESAYSSDCSSTNDISDDVKTSEEIPSRYVPDPPVILAKSLPDLLMFNPSVNDMGKSSSTVLENSGLDGQGLTSSLTMAEITTHKFLVRRISLDERGHHGSNRKESLQNSLSTADSKASTLVASLTMDDEEEDDYDSDSFAGSQEDYNNTEYKPSRALHRNSVVDEWNIPFENIRLGECIGRGRMSNVYKGNWHGKVAIKHFYKPNATYQQIKKFKEEVSVLKRTRHDNLALFMGASLKAPDLAIITIFCKGHTLYRCIHVWSEPFNSEKNINIAKQVAQAMGYLHARGIVHKNLNTRNIFLEKDKVVITDTGLSSLSENFHISERNFLVIRRNKLYYLAPELIRTFSHCPANKDTWQESFPHTEETDIYAFGTVLYELILKKFPFSSDQYGFSITPTALICMIGNGLKQEIHSKDMHKRLQDLLYDCWHSSPNHRLPFKIIYEGLLKMSRKKTPISRSPSFPLSLSKSMEGLNFSNL